MTATFRVLRADGTPVFFEAWGRSLLSEPRVRGVVVNLRDITLRLEAERVKSEFIAAVSHELRTPLAVILGLAELLRENAPSEMRESLELILENAFRLKNMVDNFLDVSRLEAGRFEVVRRPVRLTPLLSNLARSFQGVARLSGVEFRAELEDLPLAELDPERILQVVGNLLSNAFKFTPTGGTVCLRAKVEGKALAIEVQDTGPGIPKEEIPLIFERYHRARSQASRGGSGDGAWPLHLPPHRGGPRWAHPGGKRGGAGKPFPGYPTPIWCGFWRLRPNPSTSSVRLCTGSTTGFGLPEAGKRV